MSDIHSAKRELRKSGLKATIPRLRILEILASPGQEPLHLSAEDIYKHLLVAGDNISLSAIYRVLAQFEAAGLIAKHHFDAGQALYERVDKDRHDHMVCLASGEIIEFRNQEIMQRQEMIAREHGYELVDYRLVLYVRKKSPEEKAAST